MTESHTSGSGESMEDQLELSIANSLVWFGRTQFHTTRPIVLRETGLSFCVVSEASTGNQPGNTIYAFFSLFLWNIVYKSCN